MRAALVLVLAILISYCVFADEESAYREIVDKSNQLVANRQYEEATEIVKDAYYDNNQPKELLEQLIKIQEAYQKDEEIYQRNHEIQLLMAQANKSFDEYDFVRAISLLQSLIEIEPDYTAAILKLAEAQEQKEFWDYVRNEYSTHYNIMLHGRISLGMPAFMVRRAIGIPDDINRSVGSWGTHEQWVYRERGLYLYFEDNVLTSWQD